MRRSTPRILLSLTIVAVAALCACGGGQERPRAEATPAGGCPKLEGSYFGSDKSEIRKGEAVTLSYKVPGGYAAGVHIEGVEYPPPPEIASFTAGPGGSPLVTPTPPPEWYEELVPDVRPAKTTTFILRASGPDGCQPLELPAVVTVVE